MDSQSKQGSAGNEPCGVEEDATKQLAERIQVKYEAAKPVGFSIPIPEENGADTISEEAKECSGEQSLQSPSLETVIKMLTGLQDVPKQLLDIQHTISDLEKGFYKEAHCLHDSLRHSSPSKGSSTRQSSPSRDGAQEEDSLLFRAMRGSSSKSQKGVLKKASSSKDSFKRTRSNLSASSSHGDRAEAASSGTRDAAVAAAMMVTPVLGSGGSRRERRPSNVSVSSSGNVSHVSDSNVAGARSRRPSNSSSIPSLPGLLPGVVDRDDEQGRKVIKALSHVEEHEDFETDQREEMADDAEHKDGACRNEGNVLQKPSISWALTKSKFKRGVAQNLMDLDLKARQTGPFWDRIRQQPEGFMLRSEDPFCVSWDLVMAICSLLIGILVPIQLAYLDGDVLPGFWNTTAIAIDVLLVLDVVLTFMTTWMDPTTLDLRTPLEVAAAYARSWLLVDLIAAWPLPFDSTPGSLGFKLYRLLKVVKLPKLLEFLRRLQEQLNLKLLEWAKIIFSLMMLMHMLACVWKVIREIDGIVPGFQDNYMADLYWVVMSMTTVGFGDIVPNATLSRAYAVVVMVSSSLFSGSAIAIATQTFKKYFDSEIEKRVQEASNFMRSSRVPAELRKRVEFGLRRQMRQEESLSVPAKILAKLSPSTQRDLAWELLQKYLLRFPVFQDAPANFTAQLAQAHSWVQVVAGDLVVDEGQIEEELVFILSGALRKLVAGSACNASDATGSGSEDEGEEVKQEPLLPGAWFGERCLFDQETFRNFTVLADSDSELAVLAAADYLRVVKLHPDLWEGHKKITNAVMYSRLNLDDLAYKPDEAPDGILKSRSFRRMSTAQRGKGNAEEKQFINLHKPVPEISF